MDQVRSRCRRDRSSIAAGASSASRPSSVFAFVRWASNDFGTVISRIDIVRAVAPGEAFSTLPFVRPGGEILLRITGWPKVERVLQAIDAVEAAGIDPADAAPDHWRHIHNRLTAGEEPRPYTATDITPGFCGGGWTHDALGCVMTTYFAVLGVGVTALVPSGCRG